MKLAVAMLLVATSVAACSGTSRNTSSRTEAATDAVTAEAVTDTQAAEADAMKAADAELDRLNDANLVDSGKDGKAGRVSNSTQVVEY